MNVVRHRISAAVLRRLPAEGSLATPVDGLTLHVRTSAMEPGSFLYEPSYAFIAQGAKRVVLGSETYLYDESRFLVTAVGLPTVVQVLGASDDRPYVSIKQDIDLDLARELIAEVDERRPDRNGTDAGLAVGAVTPSLADATMRLVDLLDTPGDIPILARPIQREILYRVLTSPVGGRLRQAVEVGTYANRVSRAIRWIRDNYDRRLRIGDLAEVAGMGKSTLHHQFRALTAMSPLQFQKQLRLHEARRLMIADRLDVGRAAHKVGYESATQFSRDYRALFGAPPKRDVRSIVGPSRCPPDPTGSGRKSAGSEWSAADRATRSASDHLASGTGTA